MNLIHHKIWKLHALKNFYVDFYEHDGIMNERTCEWTNRHTYKVQQMCEISWLPYGDDKPRLHPEPWKINHPEKLTTILPEEFDDNSG